MSPGEQLSGNPGGRPSRHLPSGAQVSGVVMGTHLLLGLPLRPRVPGCPHPSQVPSLPWHAGGCHGAALGGVTPSGVSGQKQ